MFQLTVFDRAKQFSNVQYYKPFMMGSVDRRKEIASRTLSLKWKYLLEDFVHHDVSLETLKRNWMQLKEEKWIHAMPCNLVELLYRNKQINRSCAVEISTCPIAGKMDKNRVCKTPSSMMLRSRSVSKLLTLVLHGNACLGDKDMHIHFCIWNIIIPVIRSGAINLENVGQREVFRYSQQISVHPQFAGLCPSACIFLQGFKSLLDIVLCCSLWAGNFGKYYFQNVCKVGLFAFLACSVFPILLPVSGIPGKCWGHFNFSRVLPKYSFLFACIMFNHCICALSSSDGDPDCLEKKDGREMSDNTVYLVDFMWCYGTFWRCFCIFAYISRFT